MERIIKGIFLAALPKEWYLQTERATEALKYVLFGREEREGVKVFASYKSVDSVDSAVIAAEISKYRAIAGEDNCFAFVVAFEDEGVPGKYRFNVRFPDLKFLFQETPPPQ